MSASVALQRVVFSNKPLLGHISVDGHFKIFPVHQWINVREPKSRMEILPLRGIGTKISACGPPYPLHLEVEVPRSDDMEWFRNGLKHLDRYEMIASLLIPGVHLASHEPRPNRWTRFFENEEGDLRFYYGISQFGLSIDGEGSFQRYLSEGGCAAEPFDAPMNFYDALLTGEFLEFPRNLDILLGAYASLPKKRADDFNRAVFLFQQGEFLRLSRFEPLVSYTSAIECLLSRDKKSCETCGQDIFGVGKKFREFMIDFASVSESLLSKRKRMYDIRSKAAHGVHISQVDRDPSQTSFDDNDILFPWLVRKGIINWLSNASGKQT